MKQKIFTVAMVIIALALPLEIGAKGKPTSDILLKDANGVEIGRVIGMETIGWPYVLTDQGYRTFFRMSPGRVFLNSQVYYESTDCTGVAYQSRGRYIGAVFLPTVRDDLAYDAGVLLYSPNGAQAVTVDINSTLDSNLNCVSFVYPNYFGIPAYPNDPNITGIMNTAYPTRLLIE